MFRKKKVHKGDVGNHKFCPICGLKLEMHDTYCTRCGYSFAQRGKKKGKGVKWRNLIFLIIIIILGYVAIRYFNDQPIIPDFLSSFVNSSLNSTLKR